MYGEGSDEGGKVGVEEKGGNKGGRDNEGALFWIKNWNIKSVTVCELHEHEKHVTD